MRIQFEKVSFDQFCYDTQRSGYYFAPDEILKAYESIQLPVRKTDGSAGYDFSSPFDLAIEPQKTVMFPTGIKAKMPKYTVLLIFIRSSLGLKKGLTLPNSVAVIDSDFYGNEDNDGDITMALRNNSEDTVQYIHQGDRVAQGIFMIYDKVDDDAVESTRKGGIGSTDET